LEEELEILNRVKTIDNEKAFNVEPMEVVNYICC